MRHFSLPALFLFTASLQALPEAPAVAFRPQTLDAKLQIGCDQVIAGWREPNDLDRKVGIRLYVPIEKDGSTWKQHAVIDDNTMACEDFKVADLNGDGKPDIIAAGRATKNLIVYWNGRK